MRADDENSINEFVINLDIFFPDCYVVMSLRANMNTGTSLLS